VRTTDEGWMGFVVGRLSQSQLDLLKNPRLYMIDPREVLSTDPPFINLSGATTHKIGVIVRRAFPLTAMSLDDV